MIDTKASAPSTLGAGKLSNFSISGKLTSITPLAPASVASTISGKRCNVWGPKIMSTKGARLEIASPSWLATQPPTPILILGLASLSLRQRPSWWYTLSWAFSRIEQVFSSKMSASASLCVISIPWLSPNKSAIREESYSFIWQPWVLINSFFVIWYTYINWGRIIHLSQPLYLASKRCFYC